MPKITIAANDTNALRNDMELSLSLVCSWLEFLKCLPQGQQVCSADALDLPAATPRRKGWQPRSIPSHSDRAGPGSMGRIDPADDAGQVGDVSIARERLDQC